MKTALYARVSTDEEAEDNNIESQVAAAVDATIAEPPGTIWSLRVPVAEPVEV